VSRSRSPLGLNATPITDTGFLRSDEAIETPPTFSARRQSQRTTPLPAAVARSRPSGLNASARTGTRVLSVAVRVRPEPSRRQTRATLVPATPSIAATAAPSGLT
jgi:hypothetical protein